MSSSGVPLKHVLVALSNGATLVETVDGEILVRTVGTSARVIGTVDGEILVPAVGTAAHMIDTTTPRELVRLLERERESVPGELLERLPVSELFVLALSVGHYWPSLALQWITPDDLKDVRVHRAVGEVASSHERSQALRHAARRVLKEADLPRQPEPIDGG